MARPTAQKLTEEQKRPFKRKANFMKGPLKRKSRFEQEQFEERAINLATSLGWFGDWDEQLFGVQVKDARAILQGKLHQAHVDVCNGKEPPSADAICRHLGLDKDVDSFRESVALVQAELDFVKAIDPQATELN